MDKIKIFEKLEDALAWFFYQSRYIKVIIDMSSKFCYDIMIGGEHVGNVQWTVPDQKWHGRLFETKDKCQLF